MDLAEVAEVIEEFTLETENTPGVEPCPPLPFGLASSTNLTIFYSCCFLAHVFLISLIPRQAPVLYSSSRTRTRTNTNPNGTEANERQAQWRIDLFWQQLQALSARSCRSLARNLHSSGYTQSTCSQGGGPCEGFEKRWRTTTTSVRGV